MSPLIYSSLFHCNLQKIRFSCSSWNTGHFLNVTNITNMTSFLRVGRLSWQSVLNSWLTVSSSRLQTITTGEDSHQICCITQVFNFYEVKSVSSVYLSCWSFPVCQYNQNDPSCKHSIMFCHRIDAKIFHVCFAKHLRIKRNNESTCQLPCFTD